MILVAAMASCREKAPSPAAATIATTPAPTPPDRSTAADPERLVGRWLRADGQYMIEIGGVERDGRLAARYLNPNPIRVSRAEWKKENGELALLVEMTDRGYPGSFYTLRCDGASDSLTGVYHHLGFNENYDVGFSRLEEPTPARP